MIPRWVVEFGTSWDVPVAVTSQLEDISWHNDVCPSFTVLGDDGVYRLWVDHPDPALRECRGLLKRFAVASDNGEILFETDEQVAAAIEVLKLFSRIASREISR